MTLASRARARISPAKAQPITVTVRRATAPEWTQATAATWESFVMNECRRAGIPVVGIFQFGGVVHGAIEIERDMESDDVTVKWTP